MRRLRHQIEHLAGPGWVKLIQPLMWLTLGRRSVRNGLSNIKTNVESGKAAPA